MVEIPSVTTYSASQASIPAGAKSVIIITNSDFVGTIQGTAGTVSTTYTFAASSGNSLGAIAVTCSAGEYTILKVV